MTAEEIHRILDDAGLAPPVHYCALPHEWRTALEVIEAQIDEEMAELDERTWNECLEAHR